MKLTATLTHSGCSVLMGGEDVYELMRDMEPGEIFRIEVMTTQAGFRMAKALKERGYEIDIDTGEEKEGKASAKPAKAPRLTKDQKAQIDLGNEGNRTMEDIAEVVGVEVSQVKRYLAKLGKD